MSNKAKRIAIFKSCISATANFLGKDEQLYICPICKGKFTEEAAVNGLLTLEDVPPRNIGGKGLMLTCKDCNSKAGHQVDFHLKNKLALDDFAKTIMGKSACGKIFGKLIVNGDELPVTVEKKDNHVDIRLVGKANNPAKIAHFKQFMENLSITGNSNGFEFKINKTVKLDQRLHRIALLRSAFLLVTAGIGYDFAFDRRLDIVREQISDPSQNILGTSFWIDQPKNQVYPNKCILSVSAPLPLILVKFDDGAVILPDLTSPINFYEIIKEKWESQISDKVVGKVYKWPDKATMGHLIN